MRKDAEDEEAEEDSMKKMEKQVTDLKPESETFDLLIC